MAIRTLIRIKSMPRERRRLLVEAVLRLSWYKVALYFLPFRWIAAGLEDREPPRPPTGAERREAARRVAGAVRYAARRLPWHSRCLVQAVAAKKMLRARGLGGTLCLGVRREEDREVSSHAWLQVDGFPLVGGRAARGYSVVATLGEGDCRVGGSTRSGSRSGDSPL